MDHLAVCFQHRPNGRFRFRVECHQLKKIERSDFVKVCSESLGGAGAIAAGGNCVGCAQQRQIALLLNAWINRRWFGRERLSAPLNAALYLEANADAPVPVTDAIECDANTLCKGSEKGAIPGRAARLYKRR